MNPPAFTIQPIGPEQELVVLEVYRQCEDFLALGPVATANLEMVRADMRHSREHGGVFCGIFTTDGCMAGILDYLPGGFEGDPGTAFLELLMIGRPYRSGGLGAAVVAWLEDELAKNPAIRAIRSGVQVNNPGGVRFWRRCGFRIVGPAQAFPDQTFAVPLLKILTRRPVT